MIGNRQGVGFTGGHEGFVAENWGERAKPKGFKNASHFGGKERFRKGSGGRIKLMAKMVNERIDIVVLGGLRA